MLLNVQTCIFAGVVNWCGYSQLHVFKSFVYHPHQGSKNIFANRFNNYTEQACNRNWQVNCF